MSTSYVCNLRPPSFWGLVALLDSGSLSSGGSDDGNTIVESDVDGVGGKIDVGDSFDEAVSSPHHSDRAADVFGCGSSRYRRGT